MKVIVVNSENSGVIGVARCEGGQAKWAVELLIKQDWLNSSTCVYYQKDGEYQFDDINTVFGENWKDSIKNFTIDEFNDAFEERFYLEAYDLYGVNNATIW